MGNLNSKNSNNLYGYLVEAIDNIVFRIYPELLQMRENSEFIKNINKNLTKEIADKMYLIAANLKPETNFGDLMARVSSELLMSRSDIIPDSRKFIINFMNHAQAIFSKTAAKIMYKILNDFY